MVVFNYISISAAEKTLQELRCMVSNAEKHISARTIEYNQTKRKLNELYSEFVSAVVRKKPRLDPYVMGHKNEVSEQLLSEEDMWRIVMYNALITTTDIKKYAIYASYTSCKLFSDSYRVRIVNTPYCKSDLVGKCNRPVRKWRYTSLLSRSLPAHTN